MKWQEFRPAKI